MSYPPRKWQSWRSESSSSGPRTGGSESGTTMATLRVAGRFRRYGGVTALVAAPAVRFTISSKLIRRLEGRRARRPGDQAYTRRRSAGVATWPWIQR